MITRFFGIAAVLFLAAGASADGAKPPEKIVVLIPGAGSSGSELYIQNFPNWFGSRYFGGLLDALDREKIPNAVCPQTPDKDSRTVEARADECAQNILALNAGGAAPHRVILVGHSMGGLVARLVARDPRVSDLIDEVITIATPHRGTPIADVAIDHSKNFFDFYGWCANFAGFIPEHTQYLPELRVDRSQYAPSVFAAQDIADNPKVQYFSFSGSYQFRWDGNVLSNALGISHDLISSELGDRGLDQTSFGKSNDGIVPEFSMLHGTYLGHIDASHFESACGDPLISSPGCHEMLAKVVPFLKSQLGQN